MKLRRIVGNLASTIEKLEALTHWEENASVEVDRQVMEILQQVRRRGDSALIEYTNRFDQQTITQGADLEVSAAECEAAFLSLDTGSRDALEHAAQRIETYHRQQVADSWMIQDEYGNKLGQRVTPMDRVGIYVPGGKAAYPSSVLMNAIPAKVAGVDEIIMVTPTPGGDINPMVLAAAHVAQVTKVYRVGGAQAVAALCYGTATVPKVDKIVGPGNKYVASAKRQVFGRVGLDMVAGPSEVLIVADESANPHWVAMDLFAQAEHDEDAGALLVSTSKQFLDSVAEAMVEILPTMPRADIIAKAVEQRGALIQVESLADAVAVVNHLAPEHLELALAEPEAVLDDIKHAGAIFVGHHSPEALGDYCAGPNHVLPTAKTARFSSPLGVYDFQKRSSIIHCSAQGAKPLANTAAVLADHEGLFAHAESARLRR